MSKFTKLFVCLSLLMSVTVLASPQNASVHSKEAYAQVITEYVALPEEINTSLRLISKSTDKDSGVTKLSYKFYSQTWPKIEPKSDQLAWEHDIDVYIPNKVSHEDALLWINGGVRYPSTTDLTPHEPYKLSFSKIADTTHSIVIDLKNVPNQYLTLEGKQYAEDDLVAYTWAKFMTDPIKYRYYSAYLPMVKAVIKALDNVSELSIDGKKYSIKNFVLAGCSKRGMTAWLTALHDDRIKAIMPLVIDMLNFKANIQHIYESYQDWPIAMHDYYEHKIVQQLTNPNLNYLLQVHDPYLYIDCSHCKIEHKEKFNQRLAIDKYIILASGDDFFVPDSLAFYYNGLPNNNYVRYIPNARHFISEEVINDALLNFFYSLNNKVALPEFNYSMAHDKKDNKYVINILTNKVPKGITLYKAYNPKKRDFRLASEIKYEKIILDIQPSQTKDSQMFNYSIAIDAPKSGWQASFVEFEYDQKLENNPSTFKLTTNVEILPRKYPLNTKGKSVAQNMPQYGSKVKYP